MKAQRPELKILGKAIRQCRRLHNLSQDELGDRCGLHRTYISDVERGARNLSFLSLVALAQGLGVTVSELASAVGPFKREELASGTTGHAEASTINPSAE